MPAATVTWMLSLITGQLLRSAVVLRGSSTTSVSLRSKIPAVGCAVFRLACTWDIKDGLHLVVLLLAVTALGEFVSLCLKTTCKL